MCVRMRAVLRYIRIYIDMDTFDPYNEPCQVFDQLAKRGIAPQRRKTLLMGFTDASHLR